MRDLSMYTLIDHKMVKDKGIIVAEQCRGMEMEESTTFFIEVKTKRNLIDWISKNNLCPPLECGKECFICRIHKEIEMCGGFETVPKMAKWIRENKGSFLFGESSQLELDLF